MRDTYEAYAARKENEVEAFLSNELEKQRMFWNDFVKSSILTMFYTPHIHTSFFTHRKNLRKRSNLSFDERIFMKAPSNIELRMPVALKIGDGEIEAYDPYGSLTIKVNKKPEYELEEEKLYILYIKKAYPMYPFHPILEENENGMECHLKPTNLPLVAELEEESDYWYIGETPDHIETESDAIDVITELQNIYRLKNYYVERKDAISIAVEGEQETFIVYYSSKFHCLKLGIIDS